MFHIESTSNISISKDLITIAIVIIACFSVYFLSYTLQGIVVKISSTIGKKIGIYTSDKDYQLQRYIYQHSKSPLTKLYNWVNQQLIALGLKKQGVTPTGYLTFWGLAAVLLGTVIGIVTHLGLFTFFIWILCFILMLMLTRVIVSERIEKRELDVMNAIDLIVPEAGSGIKNAIATYIDNFAPSVRDDFRAFLTNINERGYSFEDAMYMLSDNLGTVFRDFAQKAIYYEKVGEKEMLDIFSDITETNRLRRQLRDENTTAFNTLKVNFLVSTLLTAGYFVFLMMTDSFSRSFFLQSMPGKVLLVAIIMIVFSVLGYISTIKSRSI